MSAIFGAVSGSVLNSKPSAFFASPEPAGRKIVCGFSYIQRIGKGATTDVWFPKSLHEKVAARVMAGDESVLDEFHVEWAAVRQFELMQEADNFYIYDMKVEHFTRAYEDIMKMRAKGYRITVITMGHYVAPTDYDELRILDARLQDEIMQIIRMLYLEEQSYLESRVYREALGKGEWDFAQALPHVAMTLGAAGLFADKTAEKARQQRLSQHFFRILELLPQKHVSHDVAVGLAIPEAKSKQDWIYCAPAEYQYTAFQRVLATVFRPFDHVSLGALHERAGAGAEVMPVMHHMRGYGDRCGAREALNRESAVYLQRAGVLSMN